MWFLGMDVGTGGTRAVIVDGDGKLIAGASSEHAAFRTPHPGWAEQDPEDWWRAAQEADGGSQGSALIVKVGAKPAHRPAHKTEVDALALLELA